MSELHPTSESGASQGSRPWRRQLIWAAIGAFVAVSVIQAASWWRAGSAQLHAESAATTTTASPAGRTETAASESGEDKPACYLGVVLAREATDVAADSEGQLDRVLVRTGDQVTAGQPLATLDTRILSQRLAAERAALQSAEARQRQNRLELERAEQEQQRREALEDLLSREERETSDFQRQKAEASLAAAAADVAQAAARIEQLEITLERAEITAPFDGTVSARYLDPGTRVAPGVAVLRLISSGELLVRFAVPPQEVASTNPGTIVRVEIETLGLAIEGTVEQVAPEVDGASQMIFVEARLDAEDRELPSGAVARVSPLISSLGSDPAAMPACL